MDAHSGGMSGSTSNSKLIKKSLGSSFRRPVVYSGPLEHQLAPALQQGNYRHAPLDRMVNNLDHLLSTNDQVHSHSPSTTPSSSSSSLVDNINRHLAPRTLTINHPCGSQPPTSSHNRRIGTRVEFAITILFFIGFCVWVVLRDRWDHKARTTDVEAAKVVDETIPAPKEDAGNAKANPDALHPGRAVANGPHSAGTVKTESATEAEAEAVELSEKRNDGCGWPCYTVASSCSPSAASAFNNVVSPNPNSTPNPSSPPAQQKRKRNVSL